ncbi:lysophospholipid acyltransferase family protein [Acidipila rosea]|uniref:lysophospholipid acyltransferase family protein n=1 Tax=Acidipila rosea TaxID=768535 RepID=UPI001A9DB120|nr:lysophospholipid acyltransferase family protein [Acidipila rosea]
MRSSPVLLSLFLLYLRWYVSRHFHGLRLAHGERFRQSGSGPLIVCVNHPSWWDPLTCLLLSRALLPDAEHYAPMDAGMLAQYSFFSKLGLFPVEQGTARGAAQFLRSAQQVLALPKAALWITPQGAFTDVRVRPVALKGGVGSLVERLGACTVVPLSIEYTFWNERLPEILASCGEPLRLENVTAPVANAKVAAAMEAAQEELAQLAITRSSACFQTILAGGAGLDSVYGLWQRMRGKYRAGHGSIGGRL